tara:strand:- start:1694 stop:1927 length:234 start_codon:yes stop_codon:yes gene_type:complete
MTHKHSDIWGLVESAISDIFPFSPQSTEAYAKFSRAKNMQFPMYKGIIFEFEAVIGELPTDAASRRSMGFCNLVFDD